MLSYLLKVTKFLVKICNPPEKSHPPFPATPSKSRVPVEPALFENLVGGPPLDQTFSTFKIEWFLLVAYVDIERSIVCSLVFSLQGRKKIPDNSFNDF